MTTGQKIKELRKEREWTQRQLSEKTGIYKSLIARYEVDIAKPTANNLVKLAEVFNVSADSILMNRRGNKEIEDHELFTLFKKADRFSWKGRQLIKELISLIELREKAG